MILICHFSPISLNVVMSSLSFLWLFWLPQFLSFSRYCNAIPQPFLKTPDHYLGTRCMFTPTPPLGSHQVVPICHFKPLSDASLSSTSAAFALVRAPVLFCLHHCSKLFTSRATLFLSHPPEESSAAPVCSPGSERLGGVL